MKVQECFEERIVNVISIYYILFEGADNFVKISYNKNADKCGDGEIVSEPFEDAGRIDNEEIPKKVLEKAEDCI